MKATLEPITLAVLFGNRDFFPSYLVDDARKAAQGIFEKMGIKTVMLTEDQTPFGGVRLTVETY